MKTALAVTFAAFAAVASAAGSARAQTVAMSDESITPRAITTVAPDASPAPTTMASIAVRGHVGPDGTWHEMPVAVGGGPGSFDRGPVPQEPLVDGSPAPIAAPPPPACPLAMAPSTPRHVVYVYRDRLRPVARGQR